MIRRAFVVLVCALASSGCALFANANAHHNSGGRACLSMPVFGVIDLLIAGGTAAIIGNTDTSNGWYAVPGVFGASGLLGLISAGRCSESSDAVERNAPPASNTAPSFGEAPVDPEARDVTREEMFGPVPEQTVNLKLDRNGLPTSLPPAPASPPEPEPTTCKVEESSGVCVEIR